MSLDSDEGKRNFARMPEPADDMTRSGGALRFVVQKHQASRLHYDFRLELDGVLKSWAIPKGPSLDPQAKRLAMMVDDHPLNYRSFEGIISPGNYGAGTVMVWDVGTYQIPGARDRAEEEQRAREGLAKGRLHFVLHGTKLRGAFDLIKLRRGEPNAWLLVKDRDAFAAPEPISDDDRSVLTGRTMQQIAQQGQG